MNFEPNWASPPGATIARLMVAREIPFDELADGLGLENEELSALIDGASPITEKIAEALADNLGSTIRFWLAREKRFSEERGRLHNLAPCDQASWVRLMPVSSMKRFGWLPTGIRGERLHRELLSFFDCRNLTEWNSKYSSGLGAVAFRTSFAYQENHLSTLVWLRVGDSMAKELALPMYDKHGFKKILPELKKLSAYKHPRVFLPKLKAACREVGVAVTTARAPEGCRASGASWYNVDKNPVIHLSFRHRSEDHFWFTFFHEAGHVILHDGDYIDVDGSDPSPMGSAKEENEADNFAQDTLIPPNIRSELFQCSPTASSVRSAARAADVTPGIVVGQLEKAGLISHGKMNYLKRRYRWADDPIVPNLV